jgi:hypothetical protein
MGMAGCTARSRFAIDRALLNGCGLSELKMWPFPGANEAQQTGALSGKPVGRSPKALYQSSPSQKNMKGK